MGRLATRARITRISETGCRSGPDTVVVEEPLEIRTRVKYLAVQRSEYAVTSVC
jgi:formate dehydrogenase assembly factor FdhD